jgi:hypothetical protein
MAGAAVVAVTGGVLGLVVLIVLGFVLVGVSFVLLVGSRHFDHGANSDPAGPSGMLPGGGP